LDQGFRTRSRRASETIRRGFSIMWEVTRKMGDKTMMNAWPVSYFIAIEYGNRLSWLSDIFFARMSLNTMIP
ncbi:MAG: hypothetical protein ACK54P_15175, partial [Bacteroidota bacterium]